MYGYSLVSSEELRGSDNDEVEFHQRFDRKQNTRDADDLRQSKLRQQLVSQSVFFTVYWSVFYC